ncbi:hypothetical protein CDAR_49131 [Caerostris darwini]|uniref:Uncharacterized protein n=1 Tax=Caerostris darwini TaxID=1538125 RepID=A0AAV4NHT2_9ARAC|nr:hypothetical protein CDAR_49131 [Caerostris darwini]
MCLRQADSRTLSAAKVIERFEQISPRNALKHPFFLPLEECLERARVQKGDFQGRRYSQPDPSKSSSKSAQSTLPEISRENPR